MKRRALLAPLTLLLALCSQALIVQAQTPIAYNISFPERAHHLAQVSITMQNLPEQALVMQMSRSSPGRYAVHEFAKNVFNVQAVNQNNEALPVQRVATNRWMVQGHQGTVTFSYTLFADRGDGTYSGINELFAHLNMPATFAFALGQEHRPIHITFDLPQGSNWNVATQLKPLEGNTYYAPNQYYFMDSPTHLGQNQFRQWTSSSNGKEYTIRFALHHDGTASSFDDYAQWTKAIVEEAKAVFGELPDFDYGTYTFLATYLPTIYGDGMEHRNSTILTSTRSLRNNATRNISTVSHEFIHAWNVERIRPKSLEPFSFDDANMSQALWFAEGFTSYYTDLLLVRAGITMPEYYIRNYAGTLNYVYHSPGRQWHGPEQMSRMAPFVDAAASIDEYYSDNIFISYYSYGKVLGLLLDLTIRHTFEGKSLDGYMQQVWQAHGKTEIPYTTQDLQQILARYTGSASFANTFFSRYIYGHELPNLAQVMAYAGITVQQPDAQSASLGRVRLEPSNSGGLIVAGYPTYGSPLYKAGLDKDYIITAINGQAVSSRANVQDILASASVGQQLSISYTNLAGQALSSTLTLAGSPRYTTQINTKAPKKAQKLRQEWLKAQRQ